MRNFIGFDAFECDMKDETIKSTSRSWPSAAR